MPNIDHPGDPAGENETTAEGSEIQEVTSKRRLANDPAPSHRETRSKRRKMEASVMEKASAEAPSYEDLTRKLIDFWPQAMREVLVTSEGHGVKTPGEADQKRVQDLLGALRKASVAEFFMAVSLMVCQDKLQIEDLPKSARDIVRPVQEVLKANQCKPCTHPLFTCTEATCFRQWHAMCTAPVIVGKLPSIEDVLNKNAEESKCTMESIVKFFNQTVILENGWTKTLCAMSIIEGSEGRVSLPSKGGSGRILRSASRQVAQNTSIQPSKPIEPSSPSEAARILAREDNKPPNWLREERANSLREKQKWEATREELQSEMMARDKEIEHLRKHSTALEASEKHSKKRALEAEAEIDSLRQQAQVLQNELNLQCSQMKVEREASLQKTRNIQDALTESQEKIQNLILQVSEIKRKRDAFRQENQRLKSDQEQRNSETRALSVQLWSPNAERTVSAQETQSQQSALIENTTGMVTNQMLHERLAVATSIISSQTQEIERLDVLHWNQDDKTMPGDEVQESRVNQSRAPDLDTYVKALEIIETSRSDHDKTELETIIFGYIKVRLDQRGLQHHEINKLCSAIEQNNHREFLELYKELDEQLPPLGELLRDSQSALEKVKWSMAQALTQSAKHATPAEQTVMLESDEWVSHMLEEMPTRLQTHRDAERWAQASRVIGVVIELYHCHLKDHHLDLDRQLEALYQILEHGDLADEDVVRALHDVLCGCSTPEFAGNTITLGQCCTLRQALPKQLAQKSPQSQACQSMLYEIHNLIQGRKEAEQKLTDSRQQTQDMRTAVQKELDFVRQIAEQDRMIAIQQAAAAEEQMISLQETAEQERMKLMQQAATAKEQMSFMQETAEQKITRLMQQATAAKEQMSSMQETAEQERIKLMQQTASAEKRAILMEKQAVETAQKLRNVSNHCDTMMHFRNVAERLWKDIENLWKDAERATIKAMGTEHLRELAATRDDDAISLLKGADESWEKWIAINLGSMLKLQAETKANNDAVHSSHEKARAALAKLEQLHRQETFDFAKLIVELLQDQQEGRRTRRHGLSELNEVESWLTQRDTPHRARGLSSDAEALDPCDVREIFQLLGTLSMGSRADKGEPSLTSGTEPPTVEGAHQNQQLLSTDTFGSGLQEGPSSGVWQNKSLHAEGCQHCDGATKEQSQEHICREALLEVEKLKRGDHVVQQHKRVLEDEVSRLKITAASATALTDKLKRNEVEKERLIELLNLIFRCSSTGNEIANDFQLLAPLKGGQWADPRVIRSWHAVLCRCDVDLSTLTRETYSTGRFDRCLQSFRKSLPNRIEERISDNFAAFYDILIFLQEGVEAKASLEAEDMTTKLTNANKFPLLRADDPRRPAFGPSRSQNKDNKDEAPRSDCHQEVEQLTQRNQDLASRLKLREEELQRRLELHEEELKARAVCNRFINELHVNFRTSFESLKKQTETSLDPEQPITKERIEKLLDYMSCYRLYALMYSFSGDKSEESERLVRKCAKFVGIDSRKFTQSAQMSGGNMINRLGVDKNPIATHCEFWTSQILKLSASMVQKERDKHRKLGDAIRRMAGEDAQSQRHVSPRMHFDETPEPSLRKIFDGLESKTRIVCREKEKDRALTMLSLMQTIVERGASARYDSMMQCAKRGELYCGEFIEQLQRVGLIPRTHELEFLESQTEIWLVYRDLVQQILTQVTATSSPAKPSQQRSKLTVAEDREMLQERTKVQGSSSEGDCIQYHEFHYTMIGLKPWPNKGYSLVVSESDKAGSLPLSNIFKAGSVAQIKSNIDYVFRTCQAAFETKDTNFVFAEGEGESLSDKLPMSIMCEKIYRLPKDQHHVDVLCRDGELRKTVEINALRKMGPHIRQLLRHKEHRRERSQSRIWDETRGTEVASRRHYGDLSQIGAPAVRRPHRSEHAKDGFLDTPKKLVADARSNHPDQMDSHGKQKNSRSEKRQEQRLGVWNEANGITFASKRQPGRLNQHPSRIEHTFRNDFDVKISQDEKRDLEYVYDHIDADDDCSHESTTLELIDEAIRTRRAESKLAQEVIAIIRATHADPDQRTVENALGVGTGGIIDMSHPIAKWIYELRWEPVV